MTDELKTLAARLDDVALRIGKLEEKIDANGGAGEDARWQYLVARPHRWRRQLSIKGRNMTVGQLISIARANRMTPEEASNQLDLPLAAISEALYYAENRALIELEASEERRRLAERGLPLEPKDLSR